jgi:hypothetical protein
MASKTEIPASAPRGGPYYDAARRVPHPLRPHRKGWVIQTPEPASSSTPPHPFGLAVQTSRDVSTFAAVDDNTATLIIWLLNQ